MTVDLVIPTLGRRSLVDLLCALCDQPGPLPDNIYLVDDRRRPAAPLIERGLDLGRLAGRIHVLRSGGRGPAAARNLGWRASTADWIAFLDDDVIPDEAWLAQLRLDLELPEGVAASQGRLRVPMPIGRRPTDWERNVAGLQGARWITADMAMRRAVLAQIGGFDERFRRAFREDADLALRIIDAGYRIIDGRRQVTHPIRPAGRWVSVHAQAGNGDDALMRRLHGPGWHHRAAAPIGRRPMHAAITVALVLAGVATIARRPRLAALGLAAWTAGTAEFASRRIAAGPRSRREIVTILGSSIVIPPLAVAHWLRAWWRWRGARPLSTALPRAVLFDRDGTLVEDFPYNGDPGRVVAMPGARIALDRLRERGVLIGVVSNQSGVARGTLTLDQVDAVNRRLEAMLGPIHAWAICPHGPADRCDCRKPAPGLVFRAAAELGVRPEQCVVIGDIGSDVEAALAAGARAILVPTDRTRSEEIHSAPEVASDLLDAVTRAINSPSPSLPRKRGRTGWSAGEAA
ncbi:MAG TPA: HAD-IIIA family hydrolase [Candidatus Dormibacteraeota bacterium]